MEPGKAAEAAEPFDVELRHRREALRRELVRSNTATGVALIISVGLALAATVYAFQAERSAGGVVLVDIRNGRRRHLAGHTTHVMNVRFDPAGRLLLSASWDGTSRFWDAGSGRPLFRVDSGFGLRFHRDGSRLGFFREGQGIGEWVMDRERAFETISLPIGRPAEVLAVDLSHNARRLVGTTRDSVHLWDSTTGRELAALDWPRSWGVAFTAKEQGVLLSSEAGLVHASFLRGTAPNTVGFGAPTPLTGAPAERFTHGVACYGNHRRFGAEGSAHHVLVDLTAPYAVQVVPTARRDNSAPASADGNLLCSSCWKGRGTRVWNLETKREVASLDDEGGVSLFSPDGRWLVVGTSTEFVFYDTRTWKPARRLPRDSASALSGMLAFRPDSRMLAVTHSLRQIRLVAPESGLVLANLNAPAPERITALSFSGDGTALAAATDNGEIQLWRLGELRRRLRALGLDWDEGGATSAGGDHAPAPALTTRTKPEVLPAFFHLRSAPWISGGGAGLAMVFAFYSIRRHRKLVEAYEGVEAVAARRRGQLQSVESQLAHSQKMRALGTLAAGTAHDFNNLLSIIRMSAQLVARQVKAAGRVKENLDAIEQAVVQGKNVVRSILGYSRQSTGTADYGVNEVVQDTLAMINKSFLGGIVLTLELGREPAKVSGDKSRLEQILLNLIVNAVEAMQGQGTLRLCVACRDTPGSCLLAPRPAPRYVELSVIDSGRACARHHCLRHAGHQRPTPRPARTACGTLCRGKARLH